jgi:hypothetical protein
VIIFEGLKEWTLWLARWFVVGLFVAFVWGLLPFGRDNTDPASGARSGIVPATDALTGCQYLIAPGGGITPRLDRSGTQIGCRQ